VTRVVSPRGEARFDDREVVVNGLRLHYLEWSSGGDPVVLLHGGGLSAHTWDAVAGELADSYRSYALDLRGHGDSEWSPTLEYSIGAHAKDLTAFADHLGLSRFLLVGHSLGAYTALRYAALHTHRIIGLVVVDASPFVEYGEGVDAIRRFKVEQTEFATVDEALEYTLRFQPRRDRTALRQSLARSLRQRHDGRWMWKDDLRHIDTSYLTAVIDDAHALLDDLYQIRCPTLVIRGSDGCPADATGRFAALLHDSRVVTVDDAGHNVHRDNHPGFMRALRPFLDNAALR
jgi:pimeloyl-ACP methyl ester carboxylesterase